jgi:hypothetical protein
MDRRDWELLDKQMRLLQPAAPAPSGMIVSMLVGIFIHLWCGDWCPPLYVGKPIGSDCRRWQGGVGLPSKRPPTDAIAKHRIAAPTPSARPREHIESDHPSKCRQS